MLRLTTPTERRAAGPRGELGCSEATRRAIRRRQGRVRRQLSGPGRGRGAVGGEVLSGAGPWDWAAGGPR